MEPTEWFRADAYGWCGHQLADLHRDSSVIYQLVWHSFSSRRESEFRFQKSSILGNFLPKIGVFASNPIHFYAALTSVNVSHTACRTYCFQIWEDGMMSDHHARAKGCRWCGVLNVHRGVLCQSRQNHLDQQHTRHLRPRNKSLVAATPNTSAPIAKRFSA